jgi:hypothetical protein
MEHLVCDGCDFGAQKAEMTDRLNALEMRNREHLTAVGEEGLDELRQKTDAAANNLPDVANVFHAQYDQAARLIGERLSAPIKQERVVCDGKTKFLGRCGAKTQVQQ